MEELDKTDIFIKQQEQLQESCINLIASENHVSYDVAKQRSSFLCDRYILFDFPNTQGLRELSETLSSNLKDLFRASRVNTSPLSGLNCMELILNALTTPSDNVYVLNPMDGGHSSTRIICSLSQLNVHYLKVDLNTVSFDCAQIEKQFRLYPPRLVYLDYALILYYIPITELSKLVKKYGGVLVFDGSHVLGLIAGNAFPNPLTRGADILCGSTHKTFYGTQKAIVLSNNDALMDRIDKVSVDYISHTHTGEILGLLLSTIDMKRHGGEYARQVISNTNTLAYQLSLKGVQVARIPERQLETHQIWIDVKDCAVEAYYSLEKCHINVNAMRIPLLKRDGLRIGTACVTRLGMKEKEMAIIAGFISDVILRKKELEIIKNEVVNFCKVFAHESSLNNGALAKESFKMNLRSFEGMPHSYYAEEYCKNILSIIPGFCGMILRGGVGRNTADELSDIDFTAIFDCHDIKSLVKEYNLRLGMHIHDGICFSGRYLSLRDFRQMEWSPKMKHAYQFVKLVDCQKTIENIIKEHVFIDDKEQKRRIMSNIIEIGEISKVFDSYKGFNMFSEIYKQYVREEYLTANLEIDRGVKYLKNIVFDLNRIHYPEDKSYYIKFFSHLPLQPEYFDERVKEVLEMERTNASLPLRLTKFRELSKCVISYVEQLIEIPENMYEAYMNWN